MLYLDKVKSKGMATPQNGGFGNVQIPEGFSEKELKWSYWWVQNKEKVRKAAIAVFIVIDAALMLFALWGVIDWLVLSGVNEDRAMQALASSNYGRFGGAGAVEEIKLDSPIVFSAPGDKYDVVDAITNPNPGYWVELSYAFAAGADTTPQRTAVILPGETRYLHELGAKLPGAPGGVRLVVAKRLFHRVDAHQIPDVQKWMSDRLSMPVSGQQFTPAEPGSTVPTSITHFVISNATAYGYYDVSLLVMAYRGDALVGVNSVRLSRFKPGESRPVDLYWYQNLPQVTNVVVQPDINLFDPGVYMTPGT